MKKYDRREFMTVLGSVAATSAVAAQLAPLVSDAHAAASEPSELCFTPARELARLIRVRKVSAREVMLAHLDQIRRVNPRINAIVAKLNDAECLRWVPLDTRIPNLQGFHADGGYGAGWFHWRRVARRYPDRGSVPG